MQKTNTTGKQETEKQWKFFLTIWNSIEDEIRCCQSCGRPLRGVPKPLYFDHLLEKNKYPQLRFVKENIFLCCGDCHTKKTNGFPTPKHKAAINNAKKLLND